MVSSSGFKLTLQQKLPSIRNELALLQRRNDRTLTQLTFFLVMCWDKAFSFTCHNCSCTITNCTNLTQKPLCRHCHFTGYIYDMHFRSKPYKPFFVSIYCGNIKRQCEMPISCFLTACCQPSAKLNEALSLSSFQVLLDCREPSCLTAARRPFK